MRLMPVGSVIRFGRVFVIGSQVAHALVSLLLNVGVANVHILKCTNRPCRIAIDISKAICWYLKSRLLDKYWRNHSCTLVYL